MVTQIKEFLLASRINVSISSSTNKFHIPNSPLSISLGSRITGINYKRVATCSPLLEGKHKHKTSHCSSVSGNILEGKSSLTFRLSGSGGLYLSRQIEPWGKIPDLRSAAIGCPCAQDN
ncbi:hypothetical protein NC652_002996 [Populus alba x Populus x berolinensis]|nr:hypothetical protein NC652_002996 [Populus alba x Populus x berolinensis]